MEKTSTNSSELTENSNLCLICCSACPSVSLPTIINRNRNVSSETCNTDYDRNSLTKAIEKICEYLLIPKEHLVKVNNEKGSLSFCPNCMVIVQEIIELQKKAEILELKIKWKVETLGRNAFNIFAYAQNPKRGKKEIAEVRQVFNNHVTRNFLQGLLPNPAVRLEKTFNATTIKQQGKANDENISRCTKSRALESKSNSKRIATKIRTDNIPSYDQSSSSLEEMDIVKVEPEDDYDSNDDFFEAILFPVMSSEGKVMRRDETPHETTLEIFENVEIPQEETGYQTTILSNTLTEPIQDSCLMENNNYNSTEVASHNDMSNTEIPTVIVITDKNLDETNYNQESISPKQKNTEEKVTEKSVLEQKLSSVPSEPTMSTENDKLFKRFQPRRSVAPKKSTNNFVTEDELSESSSDNEAESSTDSEEEFYIYETDSDSYSDPPHIQPKRRKLHKILSATQPADVSNAILETTIMNTRDSHHEVLSELKGLIYGQDYFKCTKCSYYAKRTSINNYTPSMIRSRVADHYSRRHNPLNSRNMSKKIEIMDCYKCNKCTFSIVPKSDTSTGHRQCHLKLSLHCMEVHDLYQDQDALSNSKDNHVNLDNSSIDDVSNIIENGTENQIKSFEETTTNTNPTLITGGNNSKNEGIKGQDYFKCTKCDYFVETTPSDNYSYDYNIRRKVANHYGKNHNPVKPTDKSETINGKYCYTCTKCSFSIVFKSGSLSADNYYYQKLSFHYMEVHDDDESNESNEISEPKLTSLIEGVDYFACPIGNCTFIELIKKDDCQKQQLKNATIARFNLIEHYRISRLHTDQRKNIILGISLSRPNGIRGSYYKCSKCDFKSFVGSSRKCFSPSLRNRSEAEKVLMVHYLQEHVFPWETFPGLYKYGCYEEKYENEKVLKCFFSDCDFCMGVDYLDGDNQEECMQAAYKEFFDNHCINHNFNSIG